MGCACSKFRHGGAAAQQDEDERVQPECFVDEPSVPPAGGFRHTVDLRVGVLESKRTSVTLLNDYVVLGSLGKGAYGSVKLCFSMSDNSLYALKVLQRAQLKRQMLGKSRGGGGGGGSAGQAAIDELRREVDVMRSMNHPNLIKIFEVIEAQSKVVLVQEYAEAGPLAQPDQVMAEALAQYYFRQIVAGLECLHSQNVVHGDIKPDNVLLSGSGLVKIADFGQAQFFNQGADVFEKTLGTPAFMAPEVRSGNAYHGKPADMWALGVTLYVFLFGDLPFKGDSLEQLYEAIQRQEVQYPAGTPISADLRSVLDGLLSKEPSKRPTSAQLLHHPWVAEDPERMARGEELGGEIERLDDVPSMETFIRELEKEAVEADSGNLYMVHEVAASVFGQNIMTGAMPLTASRIMDAIAESTSLPGSSAGPSPHSPEPAASSAVSQAQSTKPSIVMLYRHQPEWQASRGPPSRPLSRGDEERLPAQQQQQAQQQQVQQQQQGRQPGTANGAPAAHGGATNGAALAPALAGAESWLRADGTGELVFLADLLEEEEEGEAGAAQQQGAAGQAAAEQAPSGQRPAAHTRVFAYSSSLAGSAAAAAEAAAAEAAAMVDAAQAAETAATAEAAATTEALEAAEAAAIAEAAAAEAAAAEAADAEAPSGLSVEPAAAAAAAGAAAPATLAPPAGAPAAEQAAAIAAAAAALEKAAAAVAAGKQACPVRTELDAAAAAEEPFPEQVAAALSRLLNNIGEELAVVGKQLVPPGLGGGEEGQQGGASRSQRSALLRHRREPVAAEQRLAGESQGALQPQRTSKASAATAGSGAAAAMGAYGRHASLPFPSPFESGMFDPAASLARPISHHPSMSPAEAAAAAAATAPIAIPGAAGAAAAGPSATALGSSSARQSLLAPSPGPASLPASTPAGRTPVGFSAPKRVSALSRDPGAGAPVQHTSDVWAGFRQQLAQKPIEGVRFVSVPAGTTIDVGRTKGSVCLLVESGESNWGRDGPAAVCRGAQLYLPCTAFLLPLRHAVSPACPVACLRAHPSVNCMLGACLPLPSPAAGLVDVRYVAALPVHMLSKHRRQQREQHAQRTQTMDLMTGWSGILGLGRKSSRGAAGSGVLGLGRRSSHATAGSGKRASSSSCSSSSEGEGSEEEEGRLERRDSIARGPDAQAVKSSCRRPECLDASPSLKVTVEKVLARAQQILDSAADSSELNMLAGLRGPNDFIGVQYLLDPTQHHGLAERWRPVLVARTEVQGVLLTRPAVELVLKHYPLAQVYLRITLSKGRAELLQLETLENIASCMRPSKGTAASRGARPPGMGKLSSRLDLFRAVSFARRLAAEVAEQVAAPAAAAADSPSTKPAPAATHFSSLLIRDFALIQEQRVQLAPGLTVITGESGSGKSVLVEAFGQILGAPASDDAVRPPATSALVEAQVVVAPRDQLLLRHLLGELGVPQRACRELSALTLRRELLKAQDGSIRSRAFVNGSPTSVRVLREVGQLLVDVNGQHAALSLKDGATRLRLLDRLAGTTAEADAFASTLAKWQEAQAQLRELDALSDEQQREAMQQLVDDVHAAGVEPGEDRSLRQQLRQLDGRRAAAERCRLVSVGLGGGGGEGGIAEALREVQLQVKQLLSQEERLAAQAAADREEAAGATEGPPMVDDAEAEEHVAEGGSAAGMLQSAVELLDRAQAVLDVAEEQVVSYACLYRFSQAEYDELSARLQQLERLMKQHGASSADELLDLAQRQGAALDLYFQLEGQRDSLEAEAARLRDAARQQALDLSRQRRTAAGRLGEAVQAVLGDLAMAGSRFEVRLSWTPMSAAAGSGMGSSHASSSGGGLAIGAAEAAACGQEGGAYRVRPGGLDSAEFLFAAGPGEPLRPLASVASGGESARLMLALKAAPAFVLAGSEHSSGSNSSDGGSSSSSYGNGDTSSSSSTGVGSQIMILDEIDSGVGARLGQPIGRILRRMAGTGGERTGQILCVSHLPQVAAHCEHHLCVRKAMAADNRVVTEFEPLSRRPERLKEISAMLGLNEAAAEELLQAAAQP
ncbi:hypothetical protein ABPG75_011405 [Micractinium tetrahymenae]